MAEERWRKAKEKVVEGILASISGISRLADLSIPIQDVSVRLVREPRPLTPDALRPHAISTIPVSASPLTTARPSTKASSRFGEWRDMRRKGHIAAVKTTCSIEKLPDRKRFSFILPPVQTVQVKKASPKIVFIPNPKPRFKTPELASRQPMQPRIRISTKKELSTPRCYQNAQIITVRDEDSPRSVTKFVLNRPLLQVRSRIELNTQEGDSRHRPRWVLPKYESARPKPPAELFPPDVNLQKSVRDRFLLSQLISPEQKS